MSVFVNNEDPLFWTPSGRSKAAAAESSMRQIGEYSLSQRIGSGGMAEVWMAQRWTMGGQKTVAVKLLASNYADKPEYRQLFLEEARLSMLLSNSAIVHVFDAGEVDGQCYLAMEWVNGVNLSELQTQMWERGEKLPLHVGVYIISEVLRALDFAHNLEAGGASTVVHRDVSPQNVMLSRAGEVKLMDFGVARFSTEETSGVHVKGKLRYMAPEQLRGQSRDPTVDLFPVGAMLHEMVDGRRFREATDEGCLIGMIFSGEIPALSVPAASVPPQIEALRQALLAYDPSSRVCSAREAMRMLSHWPHHRHAALDLAALVQRQQDWNRARHEAAAASQSDELTVQSRDEDTSTSRYPDRPSSNPTTDSALRMIDTSRVSAWPKRRGEESSVRRTQADRRRRWLAAGLVAGLGLLVGGLGIGVAVASVEPTEAVEPTASASLPFELPQPDVEAVLGEWVERLPKPAPPAPSDSGDIVILEPAPPLDEIAKKSPPQVKVKVKFISKDGKACEVRAGGRIRTLQPVLEVMLPATSQSISIRRAYEKSWKPQKPRLKLAPNHKYKVYIDCSAGTATTMVES